MNKQIFILAMTALGFVACSSDETIASQATSEANEISFRAFNTGLTRGADASFNTNGSAFKVTALISGSSTVYFKNVEFSYNGSNYTSADKYYWPSGYNLDFYAYAPIGDVVGEFDQQGNGVQIAPSTDGTTYDADSYNKFIVVPANELVPTNNQVDFVFAKAKNWGKLTGSAGQNNGTNGVTINFRHAESKVVVKLKNSNPNLYFTVGRVIIGNLTTAGVFEYPTGTDIETSGQNNATLPFSYWTPDYQETYDYVLAYTPTADFTTATATQAGDEQILIPQALTAATTYSGNNINNWAEEQNGSSFDGPCIVVSYKVQNGNQNGEYIVGAADDNGYPANPEYITAIWPLSTITWNPGYKYTYTVDLAGGGYYANNNTGDEALDPVLGGSEIMFATVTVDGWGDGGTEFVDAPSYVAGKNRTLNVGTGASQYTFYVTGFAANEAVTIGTGGTTSIFNTVTPNGSTTADASGVLKITFTVNETTGANSGTITINSATDAHDTTITVSQPAAS